MAKAKRLLATKEKADKATAAAKAVEETDKRCVLYLRVSTMSQVKTDYNPEGISLPAQREACETKAAALGAKIAREFVEPGRSATSVEKRPVFQEMLAWLKAEKNIDFVIVYQFNRMFRNSIDAAITKKELAKYGTRVVPTIMDLGEGPESAMVETIMHAVDEYRSKADGADISYKMAAKARSGGTLGRAPLGYLNARDTSEGRNIGIIKFDPERSELVKTAFELYATGDYSLDQLVEEMETRGLTGRPGRFPGGPVSRTKFDSMLRDPYYIGYTSYKGELIEGRHERLISDELFERVQQILDQRSGNGKRQRRFSHYLKGMLWCGQCHQKGVESRMIMQWAKGNGGKYLYFFCRRKQQHECDSRYAESEAVEAALIDFYATLHFPGRDADYLKERMHEAIDEEEKATKLLHEQLTDEILHLDRQEDNLIDLVADGKITVPKARKRLNELKVKKVSLAERMGNVSDRLNEAVMLIERALALLDNPQNLYARMSPEQRQLLNQAIFEKLYVCDREIEEAVFVPPFDELLDARDAVLAKRSRKARPTARVRTAGRTGVVDGGATLATVLCGGGSNTGVMVEVSGLEPPTSTLRT